MAITIELDAVTAEKAGHVAYVKIRGTSGETLKTLSDAWDGDAKEFKNAIRDRIRAASAAHDAVLQAETDIKKALADLAVEIERDK